MIAPGTLFEEFGFHYYGPIDGHDLDALIPTLENLKRSRARSSCTSSPRRARATNWPKTDPILYHGVGKFADLRRHPVRQGRRQADLHAGFRRLAVRHGQPPTTRLVGITPAMREGSGMVRFPANTPTATTMSASPSSTVTFAAGLACEGLKPVVAIYSTFLQRAYDQLVHDVALQNLPSSFSPSTAAAVGADGPTHHGTFDLSYVTCIPNMVVMTPSDEAECRRMLSTALRWIARQWCVTRAAAAPAPSRRRNSTPCRVGKGNPPSRQGRRPARLRQLLAAALAAGEAKSMPRSPTCASSNRSTRDLIVELAGNHSAGGHRRNAVIGGAGSEVERCWRTRAERAGLRLGLADRFIDHGEQGQLLRRTGPRQRTASSAQCANPRQTNGRENS